MLNEAVSPVTHFISTMPITANKWLSVDCASWVKCHHVQCRFSPNESGDVWKSPGTCSSETWGSCGLVAGRKMITASNTLPLTSPSFPSLIKQYLIGEKCMHTEHTCAPYRTICAYVCLCRCWTPSCVCNQENGIDCTLLVNKHKEAKHRKMAAITLKEYKFLRTI